MRQPLSSLTQRQRDVYEFVVQHVEEHGCQPSYREMMGAFGISSVNGLRGHLQALEKKGWVILSNEARSLGLPGVRFQRIVEEAAHES